MQHQQQHTLTQQGRQLLDVGRQGRLLIKQRPAHQHNSQRAVPGSLHQLRDPPPRGIVSPQQQQQQQVPQPPQPLQQPDQQQQLPHPQQQHRQQQQQRRPYLQQQSLRDKNLSFSGALRGTKTLSDLLQLLENPQWGEALGDLDAVSVVGALVWLVKSSEWQQLQGEGSVGQQQWRVKRQCLACIQALVDRAESLVLAQQQAQTAAVSSSSSTADAAAAAAAAAAPLIRPAELANLIYCTGKLQQQRPQLLAAAAAGLQLDLYACSTTELQRLIGGLAAARVNPGEDWMLGFCKAAQAKFFGCSPSQLSALVYGVARLGYRPPDVWIAAWLEASLPLLPAMSAQQHANSAWGLSCFRFQAPPGWLSAFYTATSSTLPQQAPPGFSQLSISLLTLSGGQPPPQDWTQALLAAVQPQLGRCELLQLCNLGKALANWQCCPDEGWMAAWLEASLPLLPAATPVDLSVLLWSCYKLSYVPQQRWLEAWFASTAVSLPRCGPLQLATMSLVLGEWGLVPTPGFSIDFWRATRARFADFTPYQLSVLLWGLAQARRTLPPSWATALLSSFTQHLQQNEEEAEPGDVIRFVRALSGVVVKPHGSASWVVKTPGVNQQLGEVVGWVVPRLGEVQPKWLVQLVQALLRLRVGLPGDVVQGLNDAAARMDERLEPKQRGRLAGAFKELRKRSQQQQQQQQQQEGMVGRQREQPQERRMAGGEWRPEEQQGPDMLW